MGVEAKSKLPELFCKCHKFQNVIQYVSFHSHLPNGWSWLSECVRSGGFTLPTKSQHRLFVSILLFTCGFAEHQHTYEIHGHINKSHMSPGQQTFLIIHRPPIICVYAIKVAAFLFSTQNAKSRWQHFNILRKNRYFRGWASIEFWAKATLWLLN